MAGEPGPLDGDIVSRINRANWSSYESHPEQARQINGRPYSARSTFTLPVNADIIYFITRGLCQNGDVHIAQSDGVERGTVEVDVRAEYYDEANLNGVTVCKLKRQDEYGIGIYTPSWQWLSGPRDQVRFKVTFTFPSASRDTPLHIKRFETETKRYAYMVANVWETLIFDHVSLTTSHAHIDAATMAVKHGTFKSSKGYIFGIYRVSGSLELVASDGTIDITAILLNENPLPTELDMRTNNHRIRCKVALRTPSNTGGTFKVSAHTSNAPVELRYADAPVESHLISEAVTSNSKASAHMHRTFEGSFLVATLNAAAELTQGGGDEDPAKLGRQRVVKRHKVGQSIGGAVYWGEGGNPRGSSLVQSSNGQVALQV